MNLKNILFQNMQGNGQQLSSVGKSLAHRCGLQKHGEFLCTVPQTFSLIYVGKWISVAQIIGETCIQY
jgi:hypothetical protein